jgi:hypothetical protein
MSIQGFFSRKRISFDDPLQVDIAVRKAVLRIFGQGTENTQVCSPKGPEMLIHVPEGPPAKKLTASGDFGGVVVKKLAPGVIVRKIVGKPG